MTIALLDATARVLADVAAPPGRNTALVVDVDGEGRAGGTIVLCGPDGAPEDILERLDALPMDVGEGVAAVITGVLAARPDQAEIAAALRAGGARVVVTADPSRALVSVALLTDGAWLVLAVGRVPAGGHVH